MLGTWGWFHIWRWRHKSELFSFADCVAFWGYFHIGYSRDAGVLIRIWNVLEDLRRTFGMLIRLLCFHSNVKIDFHFISIFEWNSMNRGFGVLGFWGFMLKLCHKAGIIVRNQLRFLKITTDAWIDSFNKRKGVQLATTHRSKLAKLRSICVYPCSSVVILLILLFVLQPLVKFARVLE